MADLVSIQSAQQQLRWTDSDVALKRDELQSLIDQATAIIIATCETTAHWRDITVTWTEANLPLTVKAAILKQVAYLDQYRGDETRGDGTEAMLAPGVRGLLWFTSDPVVI